MTIVYFDGSFLREEEVSISFTDRGFLFGDGAYATIQVRDGVPLFLERHLERLRAQCQSFYLEMPPLSSLEIYQLIACNRAESGIWRLKIIVSGGDSPDYRLPKREGRILAFLAPFTKPPSHPLKLSLFTYPFSLCHASFKSLAHLNRLYVMEEALQQGFDDAITLTEKKLVLEASFGNLFWVEESTFYTPSPELPLYFGVTIERMAENAKALGYEVKKVKTPLSRLPRGGVYFRTNSMGGVRPVSQIGPMPCRLDEGVARIFIGLYEKEILEHMQVCS